jgi:hypothetical protein
MKRLVKLAGILMIAGLVFNPFPGQAFNSATHIYIADHVFPFAFDKINLFYGAIAPDLSSYVYPPEAWEYSFDDTHYDFIKLPFTWWKPGQYAFAKGWQTHNEEWGADRYAHLPYKGHDGYVIAKSDELIAALEFPNEAQYQELAHFAVEVAVDLLLIEHNDHYLGEKLLGAALLRSQEDVDLLVKTFVPDAVSRQTLTGGESNFRELVINYGMALSLPPVPRMTALGELGVQIAAQMGVVITPADVQAILQAAMNICQGDYMPPIQLSIQKIKSHAGLIR